ncbi:MAG: serine hydrolase domain-containing protein [Bacillota bacterium]
MKKSIILFTLLLCVLLVFFPNIYSNEANTEKINNKIDLVVNRAINTNRIPGIALSVVKDGDIIYSKGFQRSVKSNDKKITADTPLYIGSISKSFTSLAIMQLVEKGKINLDDSIDEYLSFFEVDKNNFTGEITIRQLLHHRSGMSEEEYMESLPGDFSIEEGVEDLQGMKLSYKPGDKFNYFNPNYNILGLIVEKVSNMSYEDYIKENILTPLEMENTYLEKEVIKEKVPNGHISFFSFPIKKEEEFKKHSLPSGFIVSTANDMANYLIFQQTGEYKKKKLIENSTLNKMHTPWEKAKTGYAMGWNIGEKFGYKTIEHGGSLYSYSANMAMLPEKNAGVILLINQNHFVYNIISNNQLVDNLLKILINPDIVTNELSFIPLGTIFIVLALIAILTIVKDIYQLLNLKKWKKKIEGKSKFKIHFDIISDLLMPSSLIIIIPFIFDMIFNRKMTFLPAFYLMPGVVSWLILSSILNISKGILKIIKIKHKE